jgi:hypothetical protein
MKPAANLLNRTGTSPILTHVKTSTERTTTYTPASNRIQIMASVPAIEDCTDTRPHGDGISRLNKYARQVNKSEWQGWGMLHAWGHEKFRRA